MERRAACITKHSRGIFQLAAIEVGGWPGANGWVHAVLLRQQTHWHASLMRYNMTAAFKNNDSSTRRKSHIIPADQGCLQDPQ